MSKKIAFETKQEYLQKDWQTGKHSVHEQTSLDENGL